MRCYELGANEISGGSCQLICLNDRVTGIELPRFARDDDEYEHLSEYFPTTGKGKRTIRESEIVVKGSPAPSLPAEAEAEVVSAEDGDAMDVEESSLSCPAHGVAHLYIMLSPRPLPHTLHI